MEQTKRELILEKVKEAGFAEWRAAHKATKDEKAGLHKDRKDAGYGAVARLGAKRLDKWDAAKASLTPGSKMPLHGLTAENQGKIKEWYGDKRKGVAKQHDKDKRKADIDKEAGVASEAVGKAWAAMKGGAKDWATGAGKVVKGVAEEAREYGSAVSGKNVEALDDVKGLFKKRPKIDAAHKAAVSEARRDTRFARMGTAVGATGGLAAGVGYESLKKDK